MLQPEGDSHSSATAHTEVAPSCASVHRGGPLGTRSPQLKRRSAGSPRTPQERKEGGSTLAHKSCAAVRGRASCRQGASVLLEGSTWLQPTSEQQKQAHALIPVYVSSSVPGCKGVGWCTDPFAAFLMFSNVVVISLPAFQGAVFCGNTGLQPEQGPECRTTPAKAGQCPRMTNTSGGLQKRVHHSHKHPPPYSLLSPGLPSRGPRPPPSDLAPP